MNRKDHGKRQSRKMDSKSAPFQRRTGSREAARHFLIVCEDKVSAPNYFLALKRSHQRLSATKIEGCGNRTDPLQVVNAAMIRRDRAKKDGSKFDAVWCVIDGDAHRVGAIAQARKLATKEGIQLAITTPCFEYWILLHFKDCNPIFQDCNAVIKELRGNVGSYDKATFDFTATVNSLSFARQRSDRIRAAQSSKLPEKQNPCSEIHLLIAALLGDDPP